MSQALVGNFVLKPVTISSGGSLSAAVDALGLLLLGIKMPAAWTTAGLTFSGSVDGGTTYQDLYDEDGNEVGWTGAAVDRILFQAGAQPILCGMTHLKIRSGTSGTPVTQTADRSLILIFGVPNP